MAKNFTENFIKGLSPEKIARMPKSDLKELAKAVSKMTETVINSAIKNMGDTTYTEAPTIKMTPKERMYASRKSIPESAITVPYVHSQKGLRQQKRRIDAAKAKQRRIANYAQENASKPSVRQERLNEMKGYTSASGDVSSRRYGVPALTNAMSQRNVLSDPRIVAKLPKTVLVNEISDRIADVKDISPKKRTNNKPKNRGKTKSKAQRQRRPMSEESRARNSMKAHGGKQWNSPVHATRRKTSSPIFTNNSDISYRKLVSKSIREVFGKEYARKFDKLSARKQFKLLNNTGFQKFIAQHAMYDSYERKAVKWESPDEYGTWGKIEQRYNDYVE